MLRWSFFVDNCTTDDLPHKIAILICESRLMDDPTKFNDMITSASLDGIAAAADVLQRRNTERHAARTKGINAEVEVWVNYAEELQDRLIKMTSAAKFIEGELHQNSERFK